MVGGEEVNFVMQTVEQTERQSWVRSSSGAVGFELA